MWTNRLAAAIQTASQHEEETMIALYAWAKREQVAYSQAQKMFAQGKIEGAIREGTFIKVPETTVAPLRETITCAICQRMFPQITATHLKAHEITLQEYKERFPEAATVSTEVSETISKHATGRIRSDAHKTNLSKSLTGRTAHNKGIFGVHKDSMETLEKKRRAQLGRTHPEETKKKIGDAHRGKHIPPETVERARQGLLDYYKTHEGFFSGKNHTLETREVMAELAVIREANYLPEQKAQKNKKQGEANTGLKRTDEQKQTYREARVKWMSENPDKCIDTSGERSIADWLDARHISYVRQFVIPDFWHPYDFYVPDHNTIIEFDGAHHWWRSWFNVMGKTKAERDEMLRLQMEKDAMESLIAGYSGYRIIRIRGVADCGDSPEYGSLEHQLCLQGFIFDRNKAI